MTARATTRRTRAAAAALGLLAVAVVAVLLARPGDAPAGPSVAWEGAPEIVRVPELPRDRILVGRIRNTAGEPLRLAAEGVAVRDGAGAPLRATARFAAGFGHALYSPADAPDEVAENEQLRLGTVAELEPGATAPLTLSWRIPAGSEPPVAVEVAGATLRLPPAP
jgi:hypothetical protein